MSLIPGRGFFVAPGNVMDNLVIHPVYVDAIWDGPFHNVNHHGATLTAPHHAFSTPLVNARIDWNETEEAHVFKADLPRLSKNDVKVEIEDGRVLCISGEKNIVKEEKNEKWYRVERSNGKFSRRFQLPENAKVDKLTAHLENGVLTVIVPKKEMKKHHARVIDITGK